MKSIAVSVLETKRQKKKQTRRKEWEENEEGEWESGLLCGFLFELAFPEEWISKGWPQGAQSLFIWAPGSLLGLLEKSLSFPVTHTAVVTPLGTSYTTATHPGCARFTWFVNVLTYFHWQIWPGFYICCLHAADVCSVSSGNCHTCNSASGV